MNKEYYEILLDRANKEVEELIEKFVDKMEGMFLAVAQNSDFYLDEVYHIEKDDEAELFEDDTDACEAAAKLGIPFINNMVNVPSGVYIDTPSNRELVLLISNSKTYTFRIECIDHISINSSTVDKAKETLLTLLDGKDYYKFTDVLVDEGAGIEVVDHITDEEYVLNEFHEREGY